jgi:hypothetical protein
VPSLEGLPPNQVLLVFGIIFAAIVLYAIIGRRYKPKIRADRLNRSGMPAKNGSEEWRLGGYVYRNMCPDCGQEDFFEGPREGAKVSVFCANPKCRHGFLVSNYGDGDVWAVRTFNGPDRYY